ncbi:hypothetical protein R2F61_03945 [Mollicutes bacterium LVI A0078]|nr:hypothetical protein RZE84_03965 [Mollicutes bacterium LVI A0075]WOO91715.1 hypothetical protein R2F61_03945 [Mollicutes bacterium LVI A0078]
MYFEFTLADLKEVKSNLEKIERNVLSRKSSMEYGISTIEDQGSNYAVTSTETYEKQIETCDSVLDMIEPFEMRVQEIIDAIEDTEAVENENVTFIYDAEVLDMWITNIKDVLSIYNPDYKAIFTLSGEYIDWENRVTSKLDNTEQIFEDGILEEAKQQDDEKVFRHNRTIMQGLELKLREAISNDFVEQLDNIDNIKEKLEGLFVLDEISDIRDIIVENVKTGKLDYTTDGTIKLTGVDIDNKLREEAEKELIENLANVLSFPRDAYGVFIENMTEKQVNTFYEYFDVEFADDIVDVKLKYDKFELLLENNPQLLDDIWGYFDEVGVEGIYEFTEIEKLPKGWQETSRYISIGGKVIDTVVLIDGINEKDWSQVGGVLGGWGAEIAIWAGLPIPGNRVEAAIASVIIVIISSFTGSKIGGLFE